MQTYHNWKVAQYERFMHISSDHDGISIFNFALKTNKLSFLTDAGWKNVQTSLKSLMSLFKLEGNEISTASQTCQYEAYWSVISSGSFQY